MSAEDSDPTLQTTVLVIDDEPEIRHTLARALTSAGARVVEAAGEREGVTQAAAARPDVIVLDLGLPDGDGLTVCREVRRWSSSPIIVLSARHAESEKVELLNAGADDYVSKPFSLAELVARVRAQARRARTAARGGGAVVEIEGVKIDLHHRVVRRDEQQVHLSPTEWSLLELLVSNAGRPLTQRQIFDHVWGKEFANSSQYVRVYITHLRRKIERDPAAPRIIITEPGLGYRFGHAQD